MNDTEIRERVREAVGEAPYPHDLPSRVQAELRVPRPQPTHPRAIGLIAAILAIAVVAALFAPRLLTHRTSLPQPAPAASPAASPATQTSSLPAPDIAAAHLTAVASLVQPLHLQAQSGSQRIDLIGAYADSARTALFFRMTPDAGLPMASIDDAYGFLNASSSGSRGIAGDYVFVLDAGPRPGIDGIAHIKVSITGLQPIGPGASIQGQWTFSPAVKVQPSQPIGSYPQNFALGSWKVTLEVIELTPSVVHVQALIDGATVGDVEQKFMTLLDSSGYDVQQIVGGASVTVPKQQLNSTTYKSTRVNDQWERPAAGKYKLRVEGNNASHVVDLEILAPADSAGKGPSGGLQPTDFREAPESLTVQGALATTITSGRPSECGAGSGPDGIMLFAFATYFQANGNWYWLLLSTDPSVQRYNGPGTYTIPAYLYTVGPIGPDQPLYKGTAQLTVSTAQFPDFAGSVQATLNGLEVVGSQSQVMVGGTWTCHFTPNLGPA
jgi:hypothetical protein